MKLPQKKLIFNRDSNGEVKWGTSVKGGKKQIADMTKQNAALHNHFSPVSTLVCLLWQRTSEWN